MNLKELVRVQSELHQQRSQEAEALCSKAYHLMAEAESGGFQDKDLLKQAMRLFSQAMRQQKDYLDAYIGLSYLAILLNQEKLARRYLEAALSLAPEHGDALKLLRFVEQGTPLDTETLAHLSETDRAYDALDSELFMRLRQISESTTRPVDSSQSCQETLQSQHSQLQQDIQNFLQRMEALENEFDTAPLRRRIQSLEVHQTELFQALSLAQEAQALEQGIRSLAQNLRQFNTDLKTGQAQQPERELEEYQDLQAQFQQRLKELGKQGVNTETQTHEYSLVAAILERVQEQLDSDL